MIYICLPARNEAQTVGVLLWKLRSVMADFPREYQVLVLDDGSTDDTGEVLEPYLQVLPLTVLQGAEPRGYAAALEGLIREAVKRSEQPKRDVVVVLQADFSNSPEQIPSLVKRIEGGADLVTLTRSPAADQDARVLRWIRRGLPWLLGRPKLPEGVDDPLDSFRAYRVSALARTLDGLNERPLLSRQGAAANVELLLAVAPHVRRADAVERTDSPDLRQRPSRTDSWSLLTELWNLRRVARLT